jgi:two-component system, NtrC family, sensor kinase
MELRSYPPCTEGEGPIPSPGGPAARRQGTAPLSSTDSLERALDELVRYYRHSAAGRLVAGIVHRMNTPLQVLSFQLELLEQKSREEWEILAAIPPEVAEKLAPLNACQREKLGQVRSEIDKLQSLARDLILQGVHEEARDKQPLNLNQLIEDELHLYAAQPFFQHRVRKEIRFQPHLPPLYGHYLDFSQSFRNLLDNALEAMAGTDRRELMVVTAQEDGCSILALGDTGPGLSPEVQPLIFRPFFTTKRGHAGLGLFMVRRLLAPYGAGIKVDSVPGSTWVRVYLPV